MYIVSKQIETRGAKEVAEQCVYFYSVFSPFCENNWGPSDILQKIVWIFFTKFITFLANLQDFCHFFYKDDTTF